MIDIAQVIRYNVDLYHTVKKTYLDTLFATNDNEAHRFELALYQGNESLALPSGATVKGYFIRYSDDTTILLDGSVSGNVVSVTLKSACYNKPGQFSLVIKAVTGTPKSTVFYGEGAIYTSSTDRILDDEHIIPSLDDLLAQIDAMEAVTSAANTATGNANAAAESANTEAGNANNAASAANTAANAANAAAARLDGLTATADGLPVGSDPTVSITESEDGSKRMAFGIPKGDTGATPQLTVNVATGEPGTQAQVVQSGTAENPVIHLTIPRGDTGDIGALTINGKTPDASGSITLTAGDISYGNSNVGSALNGLRSSIESLLPSVTASDAGKFLRVDSAGAWAAESVPNASGVSF